MSRILDAWLYGHHVATISPGPAGRPELRWTETPSSRWGYGARVLSHLLPVEGTPPPPARVNVWLEGLLPEGRALTHLAHEAGVDPDDTLAFLAHYGRDTAGALVLAPEGAPAPEREGALTHVSDTQVGDLLRRAAANAVTKESLDSLPGLEPKITLARTADGRWATRSGGAPSTHILKVSRPAGDTFDLIDTEAACLDLARRVGLTTVDAHVAVFDGTRCIVISRYDRVRQPDGRIGRIHQEDAAQALGLATKDPNRKFQRGRRLPSLAAIARVLLEDGTEPDDLLRLTTLNIAVGNTDAHAKNISLLRHEDGTVELAPAYDISMHAHSPASNGLSAMDVNGRTRMVDITADDLVTEGTGWGLPRRRAVRAVATTATGLVHALEAVDCDTHPGVSDTAWATVEARVHQLAAEAERLSAALARPVRSAPAQGRVPRGTPAGGRFTTTSRGEPDVQLD